MKASTFASVCTIVMLVSTCAAGIGVYCNVDLEFKIKGHDTGESEESYYSSNKLVTTTVKYCAHCIEMSFKVTKCGPASTTMEDKKVAEHISTDSKSSTFYLVGSNACETETTKLVASAGNLISISIDESIPVPQDGKWDAKKISQPAWSQVSDKKEAKASFIVSWEYQEPKQPADAKAKTHKKVSIGLKDDNNKSGLKILSYPKLCAAMNFYTGLFFHVSPEKRRQRALSMV
jgi:hypothetical protein